MKFVIVSAAILAANPALSQSADAFGKIIASGVKPMPEQMIAMGYDSVRENYWWHAADRQCVYVPVGEGLPMMVRPAICGTAMRTAAHAGTVCPAGMTPMQWGHEPHCPTFLAGR